jgi:hypothetical protein
LTNRCGEIAKIAPTPREIVAQEHWCPSSGHLSAPRRQWPELQHACATKKKAPLERG